MALPITAARLAAVYEMLRAWPPFCRWKLPPASECRFHIIRHERHHAAWWIEGGRHHVEISVKKHGHIDNLVATMAHEMIHIHQNESRTETPNTEHNAAFRRIVPQICRRYGWDENQFLAG